MERRVEDEILDHLTAADPEAIRSRRDLRLINALMGNERWICRELRGDQRPKLELGAGGGELTRKLQNVTGLDLQEAPEGSGLKWVRGDLFETLPELEGAVVVANLILHHFEDEALGRLGKLLGSREKVVLVEPWRSRLSLVEGAMLFPVLGSVTRHDMMVSIRAGFRKGELPEKLDLLGWEWKEEVSLLGGLRVVGRRKRGSGAELRRTSAVL